MKIVIAVLVVFSLTGCEKLKDTLVTEVSGYSMRCIDGTQYILMTSDRGLAITPHVGTDGRPKGCVDAEERR
jgi:hypothetical protein